MKNLLILLALFSFNSYAKCLSKAPLSAIQEYITSTAPVAGVDCSERPLEECVCFDGIESWKTVDLADELANGEPIYEKKSKVTACETEEACEALRDTLCPPPFEFYYAENIILPGFEAYCTRIVGHEQVKTGKKILKENASKKAAWLAELEAKRVAEEEAKAKEAAIQAKMRELAEEALAAEAAQ